MAMTVKSGRWSDPTVWDTGTVPGAGAMAHIRTGHVITYDRVSDAILHDVMSDMGSRLIWDTATPTTLRVNTLMLKGIVEIPDDYIHDMIFHPIAGKDPGAGMGLGAVFMGPTRFHGYSKKGHLRSGDITIPVGATTIRVPGLATSGWQDGDELVILGTEYVLPATSDPQYSGPTSYYGYGINGNAQYTLNEYQFGQDEQRRIVSRNPTDETVTLDRPLDYAHAGMTGALKDGKVITVMPVIANLSRSIRFRTATAEEDGHLDPYADITVLQKRAHLMFMRQSDADARYFETKNMGRTSTDPSLLVNGLPYQAERAGGLVTINPILATNGGAPLANPDNVRGRYAIHAHECEGFHLIGASAWAPVGGHPIPGWAMTHHGGWGAIEDCVISNVRGAGMVSELGSERGQWAYNVVTGCRGDGDNDRWGSRHEYYANHNGSQGVAYEFQSRALLAHGNIAGSSKYGFLWHAQRDNRWKRGPRDVDIRLVDGLAKGAAGAVERWQDETLGPVTAQIPPFPDNEAHACRTGFSVIHRLAGNHNLLIGDKTPMLMERFHCLNVPFAWEVPQYSNTYYVKDCLFQGPLNMMDDSRAFILGGVSWDWNIANCHMRNYELGVFDNGAGLNYEGNLIDLTFENVSTPFNNPYRTFTGARTHATRNVMGDWEDHPTDTNQAIIRRYRSLDSATELPTPYPLAPYGRKLPANKPDGTPYPPVNPGDTPYFVLGDGTNGEASTDPVAISLTLTAGIGRDQGRVYGIIRDSVGDRRWPDWQSSETYPNNVSIKSHRTLSKLTPEQLIERWGCWNDNGTWKCRAWFMGADRFTHVRFSFHVDFTLTNFHPDFLALHDIGAASVAPEWPDKLEAVPAPRPLTPITKTLRFLSRTRLEVVAGQALSHRLRPNEVMTRLEITGGADAAQFRVENQRLVWASGTRSSGTYSVTLRATDTWGNTVETAHEVIVVPSARVTPLITDNFDRTADENLEATAAYVRLTGQEGALAIRSNRLAIIAGTGATYDLGSLGTSEQEITLQFAGFNDKAWVLVRMIDENNWIGVRRNDASNQFEVHMCLAGAITKIAAFRNVSTNKITLRFQNRKMVATMQVGGNEPLVQYPLVAHSWPVKVMGLDPLVEPGAVLLPDTAPFGTKVGLKVGTTGTNPWLDSFSAKALES